MIRRLFALFLFSIIVIGNSAFVRPTQSASPEPCTQDHEVWLTHVMEKMETIKPGMSRFDLLKVFRAEGGPPTPTTIGLRRSTFVSQDCPYFKIDVEFEPVARPDLGYGVSGFSPRDNRDVILKVSKPYLQFTTTN
jgi:hypothetical protein